MRARMQPGSRFGQYRVLSILGQGGMGVVFKAHDSRLGRDVALKSLPSDLAGDPQRVARLTREASSLAALNHPHIATIHGLEEHDGVHCLVLELVEGETLDQRIGRGPVALREALDLARQMADALAAAHAKGLVHRDLKPANVKVTPEGRVKVLDFGLAKNVEPAAGDGDTVTLDPTQAGTARAASRPWPSPRSPVPRRRGS